MCLRSMIAALVVVVVGVAGCAKTSVEGPGGKRMSLLKPTEHQLKQGDTTQITIKIDRVNFQDAVTVRLDQLPQGVAIEDKEKTKTIAAGEKTTTFTLKAGDNAALINRHFAMVTIEGPTDMPKLTDQLPLTILAKAAKAETKPKSETPPPKPPPPK